MTSGQDEHGALSAFGRLAPAIQHQIVNTLHWHGLRPVQAATIDAVLDGANCVVIAPTAGGKTEAAVLPALSLMDLEDWAPPSVLYVAPLRALLNNLEPRLRSLAGMVGRRTFKWHGDVGATARQRALAETVDLIAITPESLEALLLSTWLSAAEVLRNLRLVIVDEVHAFAGDDRGAHLVAILERVQRFAGRDVQRVGLSATVGNPEAVCSWLSGSSQRPQRVVDVQPGRGRVDLKVDYVGTLENAATIIQQLHPGSKRLVFADSRRRVEQLGHLLASRGVETYVTHSSLAASERRAAEQAFEAGRDCVIVATSALELGIDVGDLDHVLQIDAPSTVSAFLQRMGRTGRRPGAVTNCTFLATDDEALLQTMALVRLFDGGYVEPIRSSERAYHILAHQAMALSLQHSGVPAADWWGWLDGTQSFAGIAEEERLLLLHYMLQTGIIAEVDGRLILGPEGEKRYGRRGFMDLYAVFSTKPELRVVWATNEIGSIDSEFATSCNLREQGFVLAGRPWALEDIDWKRGVCHVHPAEDAGFPRWAGRPRLLSFELCRAMREVLVESTDDARLSRRARTKLGTVREEMGPFASSSSLVSTGTTGLSWWTFVGGRANNVLAWLLSGELGVAARPGNLSVTLAGPEVQDHGRILKVLDRLAAQPEWDLTPALDRICTAEAERISKFDPCLPPEQRRDLILARMGDVEGARSALRDLLLR